MARQIKRLLIANRGEIACRIIRTARRMGIETIAVYSDVDKDALHVVGADRSIFIGAAPPKESYLNITRLIEAAKDTDADAIHPGYGFLSEKAEFARAVTDAGLIFVGPPASAIEIMGDKAGAKRAMIAAKVPCVPGYQGEDQSEATLVAEARRIGFPLMVKAAAGGGGKGMRRVASEAKLKDAIAAARAEAEAAFGAGDLLLEKAIENARHVEIQVFADAHGNVVHLGERDCSLQRRSQKIIEEAPSPAVSPELRARMGAAAVAAARAVDYVGAGTVEFLLGAGGEFHFLEMNTRIQVEHPVTEAITGLDLVEWQLRVACGEKLPLAQDDISFAGHAIEARLYAEDPAADFLPASGTLSRFHAPEGVRIDAGVRSGDAVTPFYDPMIAKIIAHGATRDEARETLISALEETAALGLTTNRDFLIDLLEGETFAKGAATTTFVDSCGPYSPPKITSEEFAIAAAILFDRTRNEALNNSAGIAAPLLGWSSGAPLASVFDLEIEGERRSVAVTPDRSGLLKIDDTIIDALTIANGEARFRLDAAARRAFFTVSCGAIEIATERRTFRAATSFANAARKDEGNGIVAAPMHGVIIELCVKEGENVAAGNRLCILEAMKMRHEIEAPASGVVVSINAEKGSQIASGDVILEIRKAGV